MAPKAVAKQNEPLITGNDEGRDVTFYSWIEDQPSGMVMHVSGGVKTQVGNQIMRTEMKEVRFYRGIYSTNDQEKIDELDKAIKRGDNITRDYNLFLQHTMKPEDFAVYLQGSNKSKDNEIEELKRKLAEAEAQ